MADDLPKYIQYIKDEGRRYFQPGFAISAALLWKKTHENNIPSDQILANTHQGRVLKELERNGIHRGIVKNTTKGSCGKYYYFPSAKQEVLFERTVLDRDGDGTSTGRAPRGKSAVKKQKTSSKKRSSKTLKA